MTKHALFYREILRVEPPTGQRANRSPFVGLQWQIILFFVKRVRGMVRSHMRLVLTKTLVRAGLALVNEHQSHLQIVMIREPFRTDFA